MVRMFRSVSVMITVLFMTVLFARAAIDIQIGDYLVLGRYNNKPILWRCVDIDENGPLMISDRILTIKPFDAAGNHKYIDGTDQPDDGYRTRWGSNVWETSNLRSWLNSAENAGNVVWLGGCPPVAEAVWGGLNAYAGEKGFLADGNFTEKERTAIKTVVQKSLLHSIDAGYIAEGGTEYHSYSFEISDVLYNYDTAYYHNVTDRMFLPCVRQLYRIYLNSDKLGDGYYLAKPSQEAVDASEYKDPELAADRNWNYWLRSPYAVDYYSAGNVRYVRPDGFIGSASSDDHDIGVRPAFYLNSSAVFAKSGGGASDNPYRVTYIWKINSIEAEDDTVHVTVSNLQNDYSRLPMLVLAAYDKNGKQLWVECQQVSVDNNLYSFDMPEESGIAKYKAFLWADLKSMVPVSDSVEYRPET